MNKTKEKLNELVAGVSIGVGIIIPGFSGGTMAVIFGVYQKLISSIANLTKHPLKVIKEMFFIILGAIIGFGSGLLVVLYLFKYFPLQISLFFTGLIFGSIPNIFNKCRDDKKKITFKWYDLLFAFIFFALVIVMPFIPKGSVTQINWQTYLALALIGILCSVVLLPGLSGSMILLIAGFYSFMMNTIEALVKNILYWDFVNFGTNILICLSFGIGLIIGLLLISKALDYLMNKHQLTMYWIIFGLLLASPFGVLFSVFNDVEYAPIIAQVKVGGWIIGIILFIIGTGATILLDILDRKNEKKKEQIKLLAEEEKLDISL
ncbi:MAG: DUF368 domain-containing protein [Bacillales bacterium]|jgi:putative membrane protein|nr:DUF368 domain-containing protein [Bacillales bacterium]